MPIYIGDLPIDAILSDTDDYDKVYIGSDLVWPPIEFPYVIQNTNLSGAAVPAGATGCWVNLVGGGESGGRGESETGAGTYTNNGGDGGGGAAVVRRFFVHVEELGTTYSTVLGVGGSPSSSTAGTDGTATRFLSGDVDLTAGGGKLGGGVASMSGLWWAPLANGAPMATDNTWGGCAGGATGTSYDHKGNPQNNNDTWTEQAGDPRGVATDLGDGGVKPGNGGAMSASGLSPGGGGGGGSAGRGGTGASGGAGGPGYLRVEWVNDPPPPRDVTMTYDAAGAWSWTPPPWATVGMKIDIAAWGGGRGGNNGGSTSAGNGGQAGATASQTLTIGTDIALGAALSGTVGAGGVSNGGNGGNTTCTQTGLTAAGATAANTAQPGLNSAGITIGGKTYPGGVGGTTGSTSSVGQDGTQPGAGGQGGGSLFFIGLAGGKGGAGRVIVRIREV